MAKHRTKTAKLAAQLAVKRTGGKKKNTNRKTFPPLPNNPKQTSGSTDFFCRRVVPFLQKKKKFFVELVETLKQHLELMPWLIAKTKLR